MVTDTADVAKSGSPEVSVTDTFFAGYRISQTHTVNRYRNRNQAIRATYFDGKAVAMDGSMGLPDFCIPGLAEADHMIPQGIAFLSADSSLEGESTESDGYFLISSYDADGDSPSILSVLDGETGRARAVFLLYYPDGEECHSHVGGIAVSGQNLYITTRGSGIGYVPLQRIRLLLAEMNVSHALPVMTLTMAGETDLSDVMNGASTGYLSCMDGMLYTGNFYHSGSQFSISADPGNDADSIVIGFSLNGESSAEEWKSVAGAAPSKKYYIPKNITKIQDAVVCGSRVYISSSYGRTKTSEFITADVIPASEDPGNTGNKASAGMEIYTLNPDTVSRVTAMPMLEGFCMLPESGTIYLLTESGSVRYSNSYCYTGGISSRKGFDPTDTLWVLPFDEYS